MVCHSSVDPFYGIQSSVRQSVCLCAGIGEELGQLQWPVFQLQILHGEVSVTACAFNYANAVENTKFSLHSVLGTPWRPVSSLWYLVKGKDGHS